MGSARQPRFSVADNSADPWKKRRWRDNRFAEKIQALDQARRNVSTGRETLELFISGYVQGNRADFGRVTVKILRQSLSPDSQREMDGEYRSSTPCCETSSAKGRTTARWPPSIRRLFSGFVPR